MKEDFSAFEREKFAKAQELSIKGDLVGVLDIMKELVHYNEKSPVFRAALANTLWELAELESAESEFRRAVKLDPNSEKISLGLFHCLWDQNKIDEAFEEMKRFTAIAHSESYEKIVREINKS